MSSNAANDSGLIEAVRVFLQDRAEGATSVEVAREVLALTQVKPEVAEILVRAAVQGDASIALGADGRWRLQTRAEAALRQGAYLCLAHRPSTDGLALAVGWALSQNGQILASGRTELGAGQRAPRLPKFSSLPSAAVVLDARAKGTARLLHAVKRYLGNSARLWGLKQVARALFPFRRIMNGEDVAAAVGDRWLSGEDLRLEAECVAGLWQRLIETAAETGVTSVSELEKLLVPAPLDFSRFRFGPDKIKSLPAVPGVYQMLDSCRQVIYVGKAKNLAARVASYFRPLDRLSSRDRAIVEALEDFEAMPLGSELEALLTEHRMIELHRPKFNRQTEVHPRSHWRRVRDDYAIVLPSAAPGYAEVFLVNRRGLVRQLRCDRELQSEMELRLALDAMFFNATSPAGEPEIREGEIVFSWLAVNEPWENVLRACRWAGPEEALRDIRVKVCQVVEEQRSPWATGWADQRTP